jgi:putative membrane protein
MKMNEHMQRNQKTFAQPNWIKNCFTALLIVLALGFQTGCNDDDDDDVTSVNDTDRTFMNNAAMGNMAEVELGNLALAKTSDPDVKAFAQMMVTDHSAAQSELKSIADKKKVSIPSTLSPMHQEMKTMLSGLSDTEFDKMYMNGQVYDHQRTKSDFEVEKRNGADGDVKAYAEKYLPGITMHLQKAQQIVTSKKYNDQQ